MSERLTDAEYEPIRSALFDGPSGQGAEAAKRKIARNLSAAGLRIVKNDPDHYICFTEDTWFIEHSLDCRIAGTIGTCKYNHAILDITSQQAMPDPRQLGRWRIISVTDEGFPILDPANE